MMDKNTQNQDTITNNLKKTRHFHTHCHTQTAENKILSHTNCRQLDNETQLEKTRQCHTQTTENKTLSHTTRQQGTVAEENNKRLSHTKTRHDRQQDTVTHKLKKTHTHNLKKPRHKTLSHTAWNLKNCHTRHCQTQLEENKTLSHINCTKIDTVTHKLQTTRHYHTQPGDNKTLSHTT